MADYAKKKNDELAALCKERGLAHTGKKADLVKRLEDYDASQTSAPAAAAAAPAEDEIDWDEEPATEAAKAATTQPAANAIAAGGIGQVDNPQAVPNQQAAIDPSTTTDLTAAAPAAPEEKKPEVDFSTGLAARTLEEEIEKRKARARKFGMPEDSEEIKALERAKRFGNADALNLGLLNGALPEKSERKRGAQASEADGGIRKKPHGRGPKGKVKGSGDNSKAAGGASKGASSLPSWMTAKDREAAEKRKARFAAAT